MQDELRRAVDTIPGLVWSALPDGQAASPAADPAAEHIATFVRTTTEAILQEDVA